MKVLMVNTPQSLNFRGGDLTQLRKTAEALRTLGVQVGESFEAEPKGVGFDVAHVFNSRTIQVTPGQVRSLKRLGIPVVMSPIYLNPSLALWGTAVIRNIFRTRRDEVERLRLLEQLRNRSLSVKHSASIAFTAHGQNRTSEGNDAIQRQMLAEVDHLLPNSYLEMDSLARTLRVCDIPFTVVPYACDPKVFLDPDPEPFVRKHGLNGFVIQAGRVEVSKNQLMMVHALRDLDLPIVLVGGNIQKEYLDWCQQYGPRHLHYIPHLPPEELASAYAAARVHALPSWIETCGLVTMEAALANCSVVCSIAGYELEYFRDLAYYCDPADFRSISKAVVRAFDNHEQDGPRRQKLKDLILKEYTWERAARLTLQAYERVLGSRR